MARRALRESSTFFRVPGRRRGDSNESPAKSPYKPWEGALESMPLRVNPMMLLGLIIAFILTVAAFASAIGGSPGDAVAVATAQVGKPYVFGTEGPGTFSCAGLMRYALRNAGVDDNAPWGHEEYLSVYPNDLTPQPGDIVVYSDGVAMYVGDGTVVMANAADGVVGYYPMNSIGTPLGFANPYGGAAAPVTTADPAMDGVLDPAVIGDAAMVGDVAVPFDQTAADPAMVEDPAMVGDPAMNGALDPAVTGDATMVGDAAVPFDQTAADPTVPGTDLGVDLAAQQ